jgi:hypothetical protein
MVVWRRLVGVSIHQLATTLANNIGCDIIIINSFQAISIIVGARYGVFH